MIKAIEYGAFADEATENIDIYAYYETLEDFQQNHDKVSIAVTCNGDHLVEITDFNGNVLYSTHVENCVESDRIVDIVDAVLGVTQTLNNIDDF